MRAVGVFLLALTVTPSTLAADESYVVKLTRPQKVGDRCRVDAKGISKVRQRITVDGKVAKSEEKELTVHLAAMATIRAVDEHFIPTRVEYLIESCQKSSEGKIVEVPAGRKVSVESKNGEDVFTSEDGQPLDAETREVLAAVLSAHEPGLPSDDDIFGTQERKRVGDKWGINPEAAAREFSKKDMSVSAADVRGSAQLDRVRMVGAVNALEISRHLRVEGMKFPLSEGKKVEKALIEADITSLVPADPQSGVHLPDKSRMQMNVVVSAKKPDTGETIEIEMSIEMTRENSYPPMPSAALPLRSTP